MNLAHAFAVADDWWALDFACTAAELQGTRTHVQTHQSRLVSYQGIWILSKLGAAPRISLPPDCAGMAGAVEAWSAEQLFNPEWLRAELTHACPRSVERIVGPASIAYGAEDTLDLRDAGRARATPGAAAVARLQQACSEEDWKNSGSSEAWAQSFGAFDETGELAALASYRVWNDSIAHLGIITNPQRRGQGLARAAVARAAEHALSVGLVPQYRSLDDNLASRAISKRLGFIDYGVSMAVRLVPLPAPAG